MTRRHVVVGLAILLPMAWLFGGAVVRGDRFTCRDIASFYYPLFQWECREWNAGRLPLWSAQDNLGVPVLADGSSSVLYPAKLVFALPIDYPRRFALYIALHFLGAAASSWWMARRFGASCEGAGLCAVAYVLGGDVLFQHTNVIFLVGAAWLPLSVVAAERMCTLRSYRWACGMGATLAMMVLGGDPQLAYHALLLSALYAWFCPRAKNAASSNHGGSTWFGRLARRLVGGRIPVLATSALVGYLLAAAQILPATQWASRSERAAWHAPRNVWEVAACLNEVRTGKRLELPREGLFSGIWRTPAPGTHSAHIYEFSVGPWRWAEWLWPNFSGRAFPENRRWISLVPSEGRAWAPSLYLGLLPFCLAVAAARFRRGPRRVRWISWCTVLAITSSLGWYGVGWLVQQLRLSWFAFGPEPAWFSQPLGGPYWWMTVLLPGYAYFRYPAKWLVIASLGIGLLAARGFDRVASGDRRMAVGVIGAATLSGIVAAVAAAWSRPLWLEAMRAAPANRVFGPLDATGAATDLVTSFGHSAIVGVLLLGWIAAMPGRRSRWAAFGVILTAIEVTAANSWMVDTAAPKQLAVAGTAASHVVSEDAAQPPPRVMRTSRWQWLPRRWRRSTSDHRLAEIVRWEQATWAPRYHLTEDVALIESFNTLVSQDMLALLKTLRRLREQDPNGWTLLLEGLSVRYALGPPARSAASSDSRIAGSVQGEPLELTELPRALPRCWIVHDVIRFPPLRTRDPLAVERRTREVLIAQGRVRDLARTAVVETAESLEFPRGHGERDGCRIVNWSPLRMEVEVELDAAGLLVWSDLFDRGWVAEATAGPLVSQGRLPVLRTNRVMRGLRLPAGRHRIVWRYHPRAFALGAGISIMSLLSLLLAAAMASRQSFRRR